jgi:Txe/YoeB family toxin of Txe-Axe toxin-antitoxin module
MNKNVIFFAVINLLIPYMLLASEGEDNKQQQYMAPQASSNFRLDSLLFEFLSDWDNLDENTKNLKTQEAQDKIKQGIRANLVGNYSAAINSFLEAVKLGAEGGMSQLGIMASKQDGGLNVAFNWHNLAICTSLLKTGSYSDNNLKFLEELAVNSQPSKDIEECTNALKEILPFLKESLCSSTTVSRRARQLHAISMFTGLSSSFNHDINLHFWTGLTILGHDPKIWDLSALRSSNILEKIKVFNKAYLQIEKIEDIEAQDKYYDNYTPLYRWSGIPTAFYHLALLIEEGKTTYDEEGRSLNLEEKYEVVARCYRKSQNPKAFGNLGLLIEEGKIQLDEEGNPISSLEERYEAAARCYRRAETYSSFNNLGWLLKEHQTEYDEKGSPITSDEERYEAAARCYRRAGLYYRHILNKDAKEENRDKEEAARLNTLGGLIDQNKIDLDVEGKLIHSLEGRYEAAARCYRKARTESRKAYFNLGVLIEEGKIQLDEEGNPISSLEERYEAAARCYQASTSITPEGFYKLGMLIEECNLHKDHRGRKIHSEEKRHQEAAYYYRKAKTSEAFYYLGLLIAFGKVNQDEQERKINSDKEKWEAAVRCWKQSEEEDAFYNLALHSLRSSSSDKDAAKEYLMQAIAKGHLKALNLYEGIINAEKEGKPLDFGYANDQEQDFPKEESSIKSIQSLSSTITLATAETDSEISLEKRKALKEKKKQEKKALSNKNKESSAKSKQMKFTVKTARNLPYEDKLGNRNNHLNVHWSAQALAEFRGLPLLQWKKVHKLINAIRAEDTRTGRPKTLVGGSKSRRITKKGRLVYQDIEGGIKILSCSGHYKD